MKTKSLLFTIITGAIFNSYAFAGESENTTLFSNDYQFTSVEMTNHFISTDDTTKVSNQPETNQEPAPENNQLSEREKRATAAVCVVAGLVGTSVSIVYLIGRSVLRDINNMSYDRTNGWH